MLDYLKKPELIFILFAIVLSIILLVKSKKVISLIITILITLCGGVLVVAKFLEISLPSIDSFSIELIADAFCALGLVIIAVSLFKKNSKESLFNEVLNVLDKKVIAYLNKDGKLLSFTNVFYEELNINKNDKLSKKYQILLLNQNY